MSTSGSRKALIVLVIAAALGLISFGGASFGVWLILVLDGASAVDALLTAMAGFGLWSLLATGFGIAIYRAWQLH